MEDHSRKLEANVELKRNEARDEAFGVICTTELCKLGE